MNCAAQMGPHKYIGNISECCLCLENNNILLINCDHKICSDCWFKLTLIIPLCPVCYKLNIWKL
jgi:hypothetical protein